MSIFFYFFIHNNSYLSFFSKPLFMATFKVPSTPRNVPINQQVPRMSFDSAFVPKTTNRTAGHTPYPRFLLPEKRKLDYSSTGKTVRKVSKQRLLSTVEMSNQNKLFFTILPDGVAAFFAARGYPKGPNGYMQPALNAVSDALTMPNSKYTDLVQRLNITSVLPIVDSDTGQPKKFHFANGTRMMNIKCFVYIFDSVNDCDENNLNSIGTNLCNEFNNLFNIKIAFGGNAEKYGLARKKSIDEWFLTEDVINLAMMSYQEAITSQSFFQDEDLVRKYIRSSEDVPQIFQDYFNPDNI